LPRISSIAKAPDSWAFGLWSEGHQAIKAKACTLYSGISTRLGVPVKSGRGRHHGDGLGALCNEVAGASFKAPLAAVAASTCRAAAPDAEADGGGEAARRLPSDEDLAALQRRVDEARRRPELPVVMLDAMLPGQRLRFRSEDPDFEHLVERGEAGVLGAWQGALLQHGVVASVSKAGPSEWELHGRRHVRFMGATGRSEEGLTMATFEFVEDEVQEIDVEAAKALLPLVVRWRGLVEGTRFERFDGQIRGILEDLGPMPSAQDAGRLAMWVAALVNPLPALGVAYEIRPAALSAPTVAERVRVALDGIRGSIGHVSGERPLF